MKKIGDIMRRVVTLYEARGAEQVRATLTSMQSGYSGFRRELDLTNRAGGYVNNQLRALGTTLRYAFAGTAVFGTLQLVRNLGEFQSKLGEISAIATDASGLPIVGAALDDLGNRLIDVSNKTTQPISDLQSGVLSLYSTIGNVPEDEASRMMNTIAETSIVAQSNIEDTTQALLGMLNAFQRGTDELPKFGDEFYKVIQLSAGMPGHVYAQQLGRLQASASLSGFTPEQMGALAVGATRFGGSPATNQRGLAQLMTFLMNPGSSKAEAAFASIGLGRNTRNKMTGMQVLDAVLAEVNKRGVTGNPRGMTDEMVQQLDEQFNGNAPNSALGIGGGGAQLLSQLFPRIEGRRIAAVLSRLQTPEQVAGTTNKTVNQYLDEITNSAGEADKAMNRAMDYRRIQQAANAMHNFGIEVGTAISPLIQYPARGITAGSQAFGSQPEWAKQLEIGGGVTGAALLIRQLNGGRGLGRAVRGGGIAMAGVDALTSNGDRGSSPLNPLYVAVVYQLGGGRGVPFSGIPNRDLRKAAEEVGANAAGGAAGGAAARGAGRKGIRRAAGKFATRFLAPVTALDIIYGGDWGRVKDDSIVMRGIDALFNGHGDDTVSTKMNSRLETIRNRQARENQSKQADAAQVYGQADITIHDDRTGKKHSVTADLVPKFTKPAPQRKGKPTTARGGSQ